MTDQPTMDELFDYIVEGTIRSSKWMAERFEESLELLVDFVSNPEKYEDKGSFIKSLLDKEDD